MGGATAISFIVPLLAGISLLMFGLTLAVTLSPNEAEIHEDAVLRRRMETEFSDGLQVHSSGADLPVSPVQAPGRAAPRAGAANAFTPGGYSNGYNEGNNGHANGNGNGHGDGNAQDRPNGYHAGSQYGNGQPGPSPRPLPTRRPPRGGGGAPGNP
jgi:hypothetical protein